MWSAVVKVTSDACTNEPSGEDLCIRHVVGYEWCCGSGFLLSLSGCNDLATSVVWWGCARATTKFLNSCWKSQLLAQPPQRLAVVCCEAARRERLLRARCSLFLSLYTFVALFLGSSKLLVMCTSFIAILELWNGVLSQRILRFCRC